LLKLLPYESKLYYIQSVEFHRTLWIQGIFISNKVVWLVSINLLQFVHANK